MSRGGPGIHLRVIPQTVGQPVHWNLAVSDAARDCTPAAWAAGRKSASSTPARRTASSPACCRLRPAPSPFTPPAGRRKRHAAGDTRPASAGGGVRRPALHSRGPPMDGGTVRHQVQADMTTTGRQLDLGVRWERSLAEGDFRLGAVATRHHWPRQRRPAAHRRPGRLAHRILASIRKGLRQLLPPQ